MIKLSMEMDQIDQMGDFTERIKLPENGIMLFHFIKLNKIGGADYFVTLNADEDSIAFRMRHNGERWTIVNAPQVPDWIMHLESKFSGAIIRQEEKEQSSQPNP